LQDLFGLFLKDKPDSGETYPAILKRHRKEFVEVTKESKPGAETKKFSMHAFGAHFVEVRVDADLGTVRVARMVSGFAAGRIINPKTAHSQAIGGMVGGLGMALLEEPVKALPLGFPDHPNGCREHAACPAQSNSATVRKAASGVLSRPSGSPEAEARRAHRFACRRIVRGRVLVSEHRRDRSP
jgi:hypothetical protein